MGTLQYLVKMQGDTFQASEPPTIVNVRRPRKDCRLLVEETDRHLRLLGKSGGELRCGTGDATGYWVNGRISSGLLRGGPDFLDEKEEAAESSWGS